MEVKIINIQSCKKGHSVRNTEHHVGIMEKSISHNDDNSNITFEERDCIIAGQIWIPVHSTNDMSSPDVMYIIIPHYFIFFCK